METLHIHRLTTHYRLAEAAQAERERLDKVLGTVLDEVLEHALQHAGVSAHEEVCIRQLAVPIRLRLSRTDSALALTWSLALAEAITQATDGAFGSDVVRYGSRVHALIDLTASVTVGNYSRTWAWKQLGLWHAPDRPEAMEAMQALVHALCAEAPRIVPVLQTLADQQLLPQLSRRFTADQWLTLAQAALASVGTPGQFLEADELSKPLSPTFRSEAHQLLQASRLTEALAEVVARSPEVARAAAALILLETNPGVFRSPKMSHALISTVAEALEIVAVIAATQSNYLPETVVQRPGEELEPPLFAKHDVPTSDEACDFPPAPSAEQLETLTRDEFPLPVVRRRALTRFGGLLFLLGVMEDLGLPDEIQNHPALCHRSSRWIFHQLALALVPAEANDPAVLAFAGLLPDATPPSVNEEPANESEQDAIQAFAARVREEVCTCLVHGALNTQRGLFFVIPGKAVGRDPESTSPPLDSSLRWNDGLPRVTDTGTSPRQHPSRNSCARYLDRQDQQEVTLFVCQRHAEIVADPGWIEVRLSLNEVSTDIRRAGLDRDPNYLPWLGVVVRFLYE